MPNITPRNSASSGARSIARTTIRFLEIIALVSAVTAAIFGYLTLQEQFSSNRDMKGIRINTMQIAAIAAEALEQNLEHLKRLDQLLPEAERTRLGIEKLVRYSEQQLLALRDAQNASRSATAANGNQHAVHRRQRSLSNSDSAAASRAPAVGGWWATYGPDSMFAKKAEKIWQSTTAD